MRLKVKEELESEKYIFFKYETNGKTYYNKVFDICIDNDTYGVYDKEAKATISCTFKDIDIHDLYEQAKKGEFITYVSVSKDLHNGKYEELHSYALYGNKEVENISSEIYENFKIALRKKYNDNDYSVSSPFTIKV